MAVYFSTLTIVLLTSLTSKYFTEKNMNMLSNLFKFLTFLVLVIVAGLRYGVGTDYFNYVALFPTYAREASSSILNFTEPAIKIFSYISLMLTDDYVLMFLICSILTVGLCVNTIYKATSNYTLVILLYIFLGEWHGSFNGIRQYLAMSLLFYGHKFVISRSFYKYLLIVILAAACHISALPMILLYFIPNIKLNFKNILLGMIVALIFQKFYLQLFNTIDFALQFVGRNFEYESAYNFQGLNLLRIFTANIPLVLYVLFPKDKYNEQDHFYIKMAILNGLLFILASESAYLARFTIYTNIYVALFFPSFIKNINKKEKLIAIFFIVLFYVIFWFVDITKVPELSNYQWIFER